MTFSEGGRFEGGRVQRRGRGGAVAAGGGGLVGIVALVVYLLTGQELPVDGGTGTGSGVVEEDVAACTAEQANVDPECRYSAALQSLDAFWAQSSPTGTAFAVPEAVSFTDGVSTGCGQATSATGPFYCPADRTVYLDLAFFDVLRSQLGATGGSLAEMYVYAHEYGHHVQHLTGVLAGADRSGGGADSDSVRVELQADCYAGMWAGDAATRVDPRTGVTFLEPITAEQLAQALDAAAAVGDDRIQQQSGGGIDPDTWTHGSSEQRQRWFTTGYEQGSLEACDTFAATDL